jgi:hypothetical protein
VPPPDSPRSPLILSPQPESQLAPVTVQHQQPPGRDAAATLAALEAFDSLPSETPAESWEQGHTDDGVVSYDNGVENDETTIRR